MLGACCQILTPVGKPGFDPHSELTVPANVIFEGELLHAGPRGRDASDSCLHFGALRRLFWIERPGFSSTVPFDWEGGNFPPVDRASLSALVGSTNDCRQIPLGARLRLRLGA